MKTLLAAAEPPERRPNPLTAVCATESGAGVVWTGVPTVTTTTVTTTSGLTPLRPL